MKKALLLQKNVIPNILKIQYFCLLRRISEIFPGVFSTSLKDNLHVPFLMIFTSKGSTKLDTTPLFTVIL